MFVQVKDLAFLCSERVPFIEATQTCGSLPFPLFLNTVTLPDEAFFLLS